MLCRRLRLSNFRNYNDQEFDFISGLNIILGRNGSGKTNLLEAISLITQGQAFRYGDNQKFIRHNQNEAYIEADFINNELDYLLRMTIQKTKKTQTLNFKKVSSVEVKKTFPLVVFSPESLSSIKEGSDYRRSLIDELIIFLDKKNAELIFSYKKAYRTRNRILKNYTEKIATLDETKALLDSLNPIYFQLSSRIAYERIKSLQSIHSELNSAMQFISNNFNEELTTAYTISNIDASNYVEKDVEISIKKRATELADAELSSGMTLVGPSKHDVQFLYARKDSRFYCSQGQQRAIILAFKMAQIVYHRKVHGFYPILMLDDVFSELDELKRNALVGFLHEIKTQIFMTSTELAISNQLSSLEMKLFNIQDGKVITT